MLSLLFGGFALDMKRKDSSLYLEDSVDFSEGSCESLQFRIALRYSDLPYLSCDRKKGSSKEYRPSGG